MSKKSKTNFNNNVFLRTLFHKIYNINYENNETKFTDNRLWNDFLNILKEDLKDFIIHTINNEIKEEIVNDILDSLN